MSWTVVSNTKAYVNGSADLTLGGVGFSTVGADLLLFAITDYSGFSASTPSDSASNTWTAVAASQLSGSVRTQFFYAWNAITSANHSFYAKGSGYVSAQLYAFSGSLVSGTPLDQSASNKNTATPVQAGSVTPTLAAEIVVAVLGTNGGSSQTINSSFSTPDNENSSGITSMSLSYLIQTSAAATNPQWTWVGGGPGCALTGTFKPSGGGGGSPLFRNQGDLNGMGVGGPFFKNPIG